MSPPKKPREMRSLMSSSPIWVFGKAVFVSVGVCGCVIHNGKTPHPCCCIQGSWGHHTKWSQVACFVFWMRAWRVTVKQRNTGNRDVIRGRKMRSMLLGELNEWRYTGVHWRNKTLLIFSRWQEAMQVIFCEICHWTVKSRIQVSNVQTDI